MPNVKSYYDRNTWKFIAFGSGGAIHRELWAPAVHSKRQALEYAHELILEQARNVGGSRARLLDLGCGVGAAVLFLSERLNADVHGVTISSAQVTTARRWARLRARKFLGTQQFWEADYCALPPELQNMDLAFAVESFLHSPSADDFFRGAKSALGPRGKLLVIDDFLASDNEVGELLDEFKRGWHASNVISSEAAERIAQKHGLKLVEVRDLSQYQRLGRPRDRVIRAFKPLLRHGAHVSRWCQSLVGGDALQALHQRGSLRYKMLVFEVAPAH
jgi:cyclopropane fatty-acyl-phospholipid synthase-like methyltransferase